MKALKYKRTFSKASRISPINQEIKKGWEQGKDIKKVVQNLQFL
jgi:hypothetical protein